MSRDRIEVLTKKIPWGNSVELSKHKGKPAKEFVQVSNTLPFQKIIFYKRVLTASTSATQRESVTESKHVFALRYQFMGCPRLSASQTHSAVNCTQPLLSLKIPRAQV